MQGYQEKDYGTIGWNWSQGRRLRCHFDYATNCQTISMMWSLKYGMDPVLMKQLGRPWKAQVSRQGRWCSKHRFEMGKTKTFGDIDVFESFRGQSRCCCPSILSALWRMAGFPVMLTDANMASDRLAESRNVDGLSDWVSMWCRDPSSRFVCVALEAADLVRPWATFLTKTVRMPWSEPWKSHQEDLSGTFIKREQYQRIGPLVTMENQLARADLAVAWFEVLDTSPDTATDEDIR